MSVDTKLLIPFTFVINLDNRVRLSQCDAFLDNLE